MEQINQLEEKDYHIRVLKTAAQAAKLTMQYGGGANRAEEVFCRICTACGVKDAQISALSTNLSASVSVNGRSYSAVFRVMRRGVNLDKLNTVNDISRAVTSGEENLEFAQKRLDETENAPGNRQIVTIMAAGFSSAFFALLLGGGLWEFVLTFLIGAFINYILSFFEKAGAFNFVNSLMGGALDAGLAVLMSLCAGLVGLPTALEPVIVGAMMPLLPGLATTNAIRDTISGDYISGTAGITEALSMAIALAAGAAMSLGIFMSMGVNI